MRGTLFVGLDVGTTTSKAVVFTDDGEPVASGRATTPWTVTTSGAELDARRLARRGQIRCSRSVGRLPSRTRSPGLGVASLAESGVLLDQHGEPVAPVIAWHDTRDHAELAGPARNRWRTDFSATTGLPLRQQWSLTKHRWLIDNVPPRAHRGAPTQRRGMDRARARRRGGHASSRWPPAPDGCAWPDATGGRTTLEWSGASEVADAAAGHGGDAAGPGQRRRRAAEVDRRGADRRGPRSPGRGRRRGRRRPGRRARLVRYRRSAGPDHRARVCAADVVADLAEAGITTGWHAVADHWCLLGATQGGLALQRILALLGKDRADLPALDADAIALPMPEIRVVGTGIRQTGHLRRHRRRQPRPAVACSP